MADTVEKSTTFGGLLVETRDFAIHIIQQL